MQNGNKGSSTQQFAQDLLKNSEQMVKGISYKLSDQLSNMTNTMENLIKLHGKTLSSNPNRFKLSSAEPQLAADKKKLTQEQQDKVENQDDIGHNVTGSLST